MATLKLLEISGLKQRQNTCKFANLRVVFLSHYLLAWLNIYRVSWAPVLFNLCPVSPFNLSHNKRIQQINKHCCGNSKKHQCYRKFAQPNKKPAPIRAENSSQRSAESLSNISYAFFSLAFREEMRIL